MQKDTAKHELITAPSNQRMEYNLLDDHYIDCFLDNPSNKSAALRKAAEIAGVNCDIGRQRAYELHKRLQHQIDQALLKRMMQGATLGYAVTYQLAADETMLPAIRLKAAEDLINYAGKAKPVGAIKDIRDRDAILEEIRLTQERIKALTGDDNI